MTKHINPINPLQQQNGGINAFPNDINSTTIDRDTKFKTQVDTSQKKITCSMSTELQMVQEKESTNYKNRLSGHVASACRPPLQNGSYNVPNETNHTETNVNTNHVNLPMEEDNEDGQLKSANLQKQPYKDLGSKQFHKKFSLKTNSICCPSISKRYTIAFLSSLGLIITFGMRCNMSVAIIKMLNLKNDKGSILFNWSASTVGLVQSSFFWGYIFTQLPGGLLAAKYPANKIFGTSIGISAFLNMLIPVSATVHPSLVIVVKILQGLIEGVTYPACHGIWRYWAPPLERSRLATISFCGSYAGAVLGMPISGMLTDHISWNASFYAYGLVGIIWYVFWLLLTFEKPSKHPTITQDELIHIEKSLGNMSTTLPTIKTTPWSSIFTSMPVYAIIVANFCRSWTFTLLILTQPKFFDDVLKMKVDESGFVGALPHLLMTIVVPIGGFLADMLRSKEILSTTLVRKLFNCGGFGMEALLLIVVAVSHNHILTIIALTAAVGVSGFAITGFNVNHLDIAPRYASILMGISNGVGNLSGIISPIVAENITTNGTREEWQTVFVIASLVHIFGVIFYAIFASGDKQKWAEPADEVAEKHNHSGLSSTENKLAHDCMTCFNDINQINYGSTNGVINAVNGDRISIQR